MIKIAQDAEFNPLGRVFMYIRMTAEVIRGHDRHDSIITVLMNYSAMHYSIKQLTGPVKIIIINKDNPSGVGKC